MQTDKTAEALKEFFIELNGMLQPIPPDELEKAKNYAALSFPGEFETTGQLAVKLEELADLRPARGHLHEATSATCRRPRRPTWRGWRRPTC